MDVSTADQMPAAYRVVDTIPVSNDSIVDCCPVVCMSVCQLCVCVCVSRSN